MGKHFVYDPVHHRKEEGERRVSHRVCRVLHDGLERQRKERGAHIRHQQRRDKHQRVPQETLLACPGGDDARAGVSARVALGSLGGVADVADSIDGHEEGDSDKGLD